MMPFLSGKAKTGKKYGQHMLAEIFCIVNNILSKNCIWTRINTDKPGAASGLQPKKPFQTQEILRWHDKEVL